MLHGYKYLLCVHKLCEVKNLTYRKATSDLRLTFIYSFSFSNPASHYHRLVKANENWH